VNVHDAKTNLSKYLARAKAGETIVIAKSGKPVAKLVPAEGERKEGPRDPCWFFGCMAGEGAFDEAVSRRLDLEIKQMFLESAEKPW
jgi:prevent-host-death family protein